MWTFRRIVLASLIILIGAGSFAASRQQNRPDPAVLMAAQREAMKSLAILDGVWRGTAWTILPDGEKHTVTHTERVHSDLAVFMSHFQCSRFSSGKIQGHRASLRSHSPLANSFRACGA